MEDKFPSLSPHSLCGFLFGGDHYQMTIQPTLKLIQTLAWLDSHLARLPSPSFITVFITSCIHRCQGPLYAHIHSLNLNCSSHSSCFLSFCCLSLSYSVLESYSSWGRSVSNKERVAKHHVTTIMLGNCALHSNIKINKLLRSPQKVISTRYPYAHKY